jgi:hypothetical protein
MPLDWAQAIRRRVAAFDRMKMAPVGKRRVRANVVRRARTMMAQERCTGTEPTHVGGLPLHASTCDGKFQLSPAMLNSAIVEFAHWRAWKRSHHKGTTLRLFNAASEWAWSGLGCEWKFIRGRLLQPSYSLLSHWLHHRHARVRSRRELHFRHEQQGRNPCH